MSIFVFYLDPKMIRAVVLFMIALKGASFLSAEESPAAEEAIETEVQQRVYEDESPDIVSRTDPEGERASSEAENEGAETEAEPSVETEADMEGEETMVEEKISRWATPKEAMVAVRGTATAGLGLLTEFDGRIVVWTTLSALDGNSVIQVTTQKGQQVPIQAIFGSGNRDLAVLLVAEEVEDLPLSAPPVFKELSSGANVRILGPQEAVSQSIERAGTARRYSLPDTEELIYNGAPAIDRSGHCVGFYSGTRVLPALASSRSARTSPLWSAGIVQGSGELDWEPIRLRDFFTEREIADEIRYEIGQLQAFFGRSAGELEHQPLITARTRLIRRLGSTTVETERQQARSSFIFAVRSVSSGIETQLDRAIETFYNYYVPELLQLQEAYNDVRRQVRQMEQTPSRVDTYAR